MRILQQRQTDPVACSYAAALLGAARRRGVSVPALQDECRALIAVVRAHPRLIGFFATPSIPTEDKMCLLASVFEPRCSALTMRLLRMLVLRDRSAVLGDTLAYFIELADTSEGIYPAMVASARPLGVAMRRRIAEAFERLTGRRLRIAFEVDESLIGGLVLRSGDLLADGSLRRGLDNLQRRLSDAPILTNIPHEA